MPILPTEGSRNFLALTQHSRPNSSSHVGSQSSEIFERQKRRQLRSYRITARDAPPGAAARSSGIMSRRIVRPRAERTAL